MQLHRIASRAAPRLTTRLVSVPKLYSPTLRCKASQPDPSDSASVPEPKPELSTTERKMKMTGPEPQKFGIAEGQFMDVATAALPALARLGGGLQVAGYSVSLADADDKYSVLTTNGKKILETSSIISSFPRPEKTLILYEFETCPFCAKVREVINYLDLDVLVYPCPKDGTVWRPQAIEKGGKKQFPLLIDPNTDKIMYESDDIINYLVATYGNSEVPWTAKTGVVGAVVGSLGSLARGGKGGKALPNKQPAEPLVFWGYEPSPFVRVVREVLCELEIPYLFRSAARGSPKRQELLDKVGHFQVPYLEDPNTGIAMFESAAIKEYLRTTYGA